MICIMLEPYMMFIMLGIDARAKPAHPFGVLNV